MPAPLDRAGRGGHAAVMIRLLAILLTTLSLVLAIGAAPSHALGMAVAEHVSAAAVQMPHAGHMPATGCKAMTSCQGALACAELCALTHALGLAANVAGPWVRPQPVHFQRPETPLSGRAPPAPERPPQASFS